jgi:hypothetical protein
MDGKATAENAGFAEQFTFSAVSANTVVAFRDRGDLPVVSGFSRTVGR